LRRREFGKRLEKIGEGWGERRGRKKRGGCVKRIERSDGWGGLWEKGWGRGGF
jgi:hypothetical protein